MLGVGTGVGTTDDETVPLGVTVGVGRPPLPPGVVASVVAVVVGRSWVVLGADVVVVAGRRVGGAVVAAGTEVLVPPVAGVV